MSAEAKYFRISLTPNAGSYEKQSWRLCHGVNRGNNIALVKGKKWKVTHIYNAGISKKVWEKVWKFHFLLLTLPPTRLVNSGQPICLRHWKGWTGQDISIGTRPGEPVVRSVSGRRLRTLLFCVVKLRNFESVHRGNATERLCGWIISQHLLYTIKVLRCFVYITWRGLAALLILVRGQCEGLTTGMGTEV